MSQKYFLIFGIIAVIVVVAIILTSGIGPEENGEKYVITENPVVINKEVSGVPSSAMDLVLVATQFSGDKTSEIIAKISKREGYPTEAVNWINTTAEILLPDGLELIEGNLNWQGDIIEDDIKEFKVKVRAIKNGEWMIEANAKYTIDETNSWGDTERFYILVKDNEVLISDRSFTPVSPDSEGIILPTSTTTITVSLGEEFTLRKGESARIKDLDVFLKLKDFIYSPCPKYVKCIWSGLAVIYELTVDGKVYDAFGYLPPESPYDVLVPETDYKTYANFVIQKPETRCINRSGISQDECWRGLARRFSDQTYCNKIKNLTTKDACFEDLAEQLDDSNFCQNVVSPKQYCQYLKLVSENALSQCDSIIIFHWRVKCFKDIAEQSGQGINICDTLEPNKTSICREAITGPDY